ncbi:hypothetical protein BS47DRAFT_1486585 [Hydnum rufescens UP504]|uniref:Uncharacterized protein n=1 Tax=Hydnum rufescens UP504 TaxID=1448309 RepID=A0A9P6AV40_9AGAM|nr:hypothetical protein BS47DRAFT_1486585 [Hydnum rufescens UP504]
MKEKKDSDLACIANWTFTDHSHAASIIFFTRRPIHRVSYTLYFCDHAATLDSLLVCSAHMLVYPELHVKVTAACLYKIPRSMVLRGATGPPARSIGNAVWALFLIVLSHLLRLMADLGPSESFVARKLRTTSDIICDPSIEFIHGGLHLQVTHGLSPLT